MRMGAEERAGAAYNNTFLTGPEVGISVGAQ